MNAARDAMRVCRLPIQLVLKAPSFFTTATCNRPNLSSIVPRAALASSTSRAAGKHEDMPALRKPDFVSARRWGNVGFHRREQLSHAGHILETDAGTRAEEPCTQCVANGLDCRVYKAPWSAVVARCGHCIMTSMGCSHCRPRHSGPPQLRMKPIRTREKASGAPMQEQERFAGEIRALREEVGRLREEVERLQGRPSAGDERKP